MRRPAAAISMWAVVVVGKHSEWIHWHAIARTRRGAWERFIDPFADEGRKMRERERKRGQYRLARVTLALEQQP